MTSTRLRKPLDIKHLTRPSTQYGAIVWPLAKDEFDNSPLAVLPPFLRTLLVTDGTVTKNLEAYFWETIQVNTIDQHQQRLDHEIAWLDAKPDNTVLLREAELSGQNSNRLYASAFSVIKTECLPQPFREQLISGKAGIGVLIRDSGMESYREILEIRLIQQPDQDMPTEVSRTYRIFLNNKPAILITENFPVNTFKDAGSSATPHPRGANL